MANRFDRRLLLLIFMTLVSQCLSWVNKDYPKFEEIADGVCHHAHNTIEGHFDGGDCCKHTCDDEETDFKCGSGRVRYQCVDPLAKPSEKNWHKLGKTKSERLANWNRVGDGICDEEFNHIEFDYDRGDCCEETCNARSPNTCGPNYECKSSKVKRWVKNGGQGKMPIGGRGNRRKRGGRGGRGGSSGGRGNGGRRN